MLQGYEQAKRGEPRDRLGEDRADEIFGVNRFRRWWLNLHVIASFWRMLSGFHAVGQALQQPGVRSKMTEVAGLRVEVIAAAAKQDDNADQNTRSKAIQAVRNVMNVFHLAIGTVVASNGYGKQCRHAGQAYTQLFGPPFVFTTPNLADTRKVTLLMVQSRKVCLDDVAGDVISYAELSQRWCTTQWGKP